MQRKLKEKTTSYINNRKRRSKEFLFVTDSRKFIFWRIRGQGGKGTKCVYLICSLQKHLFIFAIQWCYWTCSFGLLLLNVRKSWSFPRLSWSFCILSSLVYFLSFSKMRSSFPDFSALTSRIVCSEIIVIDIVSAEGISYCQRGFKRINWTSSSCGKKRLWGRQLQTVKND